MLTAITGGIGSGKSYVCRILESRGISVYDCDAEDFVAEMQQCADLIRCDLDYVTGSNRVLENLVAGQWKTQFLVLEKGHTVKETDFFPAGEPGRRLLY